MMSVLDPVSVDYTRCVKIYECRKSNTFLQITPYTINVSKALKELNFLVINRNNTGIVEGIKISICARDQWYQHYSADYTVYLGWNRNKNFFCCLYKTTSLNRRTFLFLWIKTRFHLRPPLTTYLLCHRSNYLKAVKNREFHTF